MSSKEARDSVPAALADVALIDAATCASAGRMSVSWWYEQVRSGKAPQPAIRRSRCTRWRLEEVKNFWLRFAEGPDAEAASAVVARARKASDHAQVFRAAKRG